MAISSIGSTGRSGNKVTSLRVLFGTWTAFRTVEATGAKSVPYIDMSYEMLSALVRPAGKLVPKEVRFARLVSFLRVLRNGGRFGESPARNRSSQSVLRSVFYKVATLALYLFATL
jgi:hypothetical protein